MNAQSFKQLGTRLSGQFKDLVTGVREKGPKHFGRALLVAVAVVAAAYTLVYRQAGGKLRRVESDLVGARATAQHAARYLELEGKLTDFYSTLPTSEDTETWLLNGVRDAIKAEDIFMTSVSPVESKLYGGFKLLTLQVQCRARFHQLGQWVARLERSPKLLHISNLAMEKDKTEIGMNAIKLTVTTVVPQASR